MVVSLLIMISIWDLLKKEIPIALLIIFSITSIARMGEENQGIWLMACVSAILMIGIGIILLRKKKMGGGDIWVLACLAIAWPFEVFWKSVATGTMILCLVAMGILFLTKNENVQIPMIPFLLLGYWV